MNEKEEPWMRELTPDEMREAAGRLREDAGHMPHEDQAADTLAGANALDGLADVIEWALDEDRPVVDYESYAIAQGDALHIARVANNEKEER